MGFRFLKWRVGEGAAVTGDIEFGPGVLGTLLVLRRRPDGNSGSCPLLCTQQYENKRHMIKM